MDPLASVKRAPKWAWYTAGGVAVGGIALRLWKNRTTSTGNTPLDTTSDPTTTGTVDYGTAGVSGSPAGVIVPPVILNGGSSDQSGTGLGDLQALYFGGVGSLLDEFQTLFSQNQTDYQQWVAANQQTTDTAISVLAGAGSAPSPASQTPSPIATSVPAPAPTPIVVASSPAPAATCKDPFPFWNSADGKPSSKSCYQISCKKHKLVHVYKDGHEVITSKSC